MVEYEDEFGRMRTAKRSEVPRAMLQKLESDLPKDDEYVVTLTYIPDYDLTLSDIARI